MSETQNYPEIAVPVIAIGNPQNGHRHSNELGKLAEALAKAQLAFKPIKKSVENLFYSTERKKAMYADLSSIIEATQKSLAENGLVVIQFPVVKTETKEAGVISRLQHSSGEWLENEVILPATAKVKEWKDGVQGVGTKFDAQTCGIAITYSRRYSMQSLIGVAAEEDSDGNEISEPGSGSKENAQAIAKEKVERAKRGENITGITLPSHPTLLYRFIEDGQKFYLTGERELMTQHKEALSYKGKWDNKSNSFVYGPDDFEDTKYTLEQRGVSVRPADPASKRANA